MRSPQTKTDNFYPLTEKNIDIIPAHFIDIHKEEIKYLKTLVLFEYLIAKKKSGDAVEKNEVFLPSLTGKITKDQNLEAWLKLYVTSEKVSVEKFNVRCTKAFFSKRENDVHRDYFRLCCFPTFFNFFSSDEYLKYGYEFINNYKQVTAGAKDVSVSYFDLAQSFILHNFEFRQVFVEKFYIALNDKDSINDTVYEVGTQFSNLLKSFSFCISYLKELQLKMLKDIIKASKDDAAKFLINNIFLPLIDLWNYTPQFCATELLWHDRDVKDVKDEGNDIKVIVKKSRLVEFLEQKLSSDKIYESDKDDFDAVFDAIHESPYAKPIVLVNVLKATMDKMLLCGFDIKLFNGIINCINPVERQKIKSRMPLNPDSTNSDFDNINRFFYVDFEFTESKSVHDKLPDIEFVNPNSKDTDLQEMMKIKWEKIKKTAEEKGVDPILLLSDDDKFLYTADQKYIHKILNYIRDKMQSERLFKSQTECAKKVLQSVVLKFAELYFIYPEKKIMPKDFVNMFRQGFITSLNTFSEEILWGKDYDRKDVKKPLKDVESCIIKVSEESESKERIKMYLDQMTEFGKKNINQNFTISQDVTERINFCIEIYGMYEFGQFFTLMNLSPLDLKIDDKYEKPKNIDTSNMYSEVFVSMGYAELLNMGRKYKDFITKNNKGYFTGFSFLGLAEISAMISDMLKELYNTLYERCENIGSQSEMGRNLVFEIFSGEEEIFNSYAFMRCLINNSKEKYNVKFPANTADKIVEVYKYFKNDDQ